MDLSVSLSDELARHVETELSSGRYASSSEVVREALRQLDAKTRSEADRLRQLQATWQEGTNSGDMGEIDLATLKVEARARMAAAKT